MLSPLVLLAIAPFVAAFSYPDFVPLEKRQQPGTPQYDCHADCGAVITAARTENFCDSSNFTSSLEDCLNCAEEYDIWRYYGESVSAAAESCDLDATPVPANSTETASTGAATGTTSSSETSTGAVESATSETAATSSATDSAASAAESAASETSGGATAAATSSEGSGYALLPGMMQVGLALGAVVLV